MSSPAEENVQLQDNETGELRTPDSEDVPHYQTIVLPLVDVPSNEEDEEEIMKISARLYRFHKVDHEWKERGTGDIKLLRHRVNNTVRVVMRRDKTQKVCANHFITPDMKMNIHCASDRAFNWAVFEEFADGQMKRELLAIKFSNPQDAALWKQKFAEAQDIVQTKCSLYTQDDTSNESSLTSQYTDTDPELTDIEESPARKIEENPDTNCDDIVLQLNKLNVDGDKSE